MSLTEEQIEQIADRMRLYGFDLAEIDKDQIEAIAECVLQGLGIEFNHRPLGASTGETNDPQPPQFHAPHPT